MKVILRKQQFKMMLRVNNCYISWLNLYIYYVYCVANKVWEDMIKGNEKAYVTNTSLAHDIIMRDDTMVYFSQELSVETTMQSYPCDIVASEATYMHA